MASVGKGSRQAGASESTAATGMTRASGASAAALSRIDAVQLLRALAATMVVLGHLKGAASVHRADFGPFPAIHFAGGAGVDLFFAISGFIIVHAGMRLLDAPHPSRAFLLRRFARIVPLYWGVTLLPIFLHMVMGRELPPLRAVAMSLAFIPYDRSGTGEFYPLCDLGWTLNYELEFYVLFALGMLIARHRCVEATIAALGLLVIGGAIWPPESGALFFWTQPILLEFAGGMAIAKLYRSGRLRLPRLATASLVAVAAMLYLADPFGLFDVPTTPNSMVRVLGWGVPGTLMLAAALSSPFQARSRAARAGVLFGNASFALYLVHPFAIAACRRLLLALPLPWGEAWLLVVGGFLVASAGSTLVYLHFEKPLTAWLTSLLTRDMPSQGISRARP